MTGISPEISRIYALSAEGIARYTNSLEYCQINELDGLINAEFKRLNRDLVWKTGCLGGLIGGMIGVAATLPAAIVLPTALSIAIFGVVTAVPVVAAAFVVCALIGALITLVVRIAQQATKRRRLRAIQREINPNDAQKPKLSKSLIKVFEKLFAPVSQKAEAQKTVEMTELPPSSRGEGEDEDGIAQYQPVLQSRRYSNQS
jgi:hypothetical protein